MTKHKPTEIAEEGKPIAISNMRRKPDNLPALTEQHIDMAELMVYGATEEQAAKHNIKPYWPLNSDEAAKITGMRLKNAREIIKSPLFIAHINEKLEDRRKSEKSRNLATSIQIRDDEGDNSPATKTVRLKAVQLIEGIDGRNAVNIQINNNTLNKPGYTIVLPNQPNQNTPIKTIEHERK